MSLLSLMGNQVVAYPNPAGVTKLPLGSLDATARITSGERATKLAGG